MQFVDVPIIEQPRYNEDETSIETTRTKKQKIETIAKSYNIQLPDGIPYTQKRMVMIVGDQSSGKSSFINYLFGNLEVREFTIIEAVNEDCFSALVGQTKYEESLKKHTQLVAEKKRVMNDWLYQREHNRDCDSRRNIVWTELEIPQIEERYKHLYDDANLHDAFRSVLRAVIVNTRFLFGTDIEREDSFTRTFSRDLIIIDTPGFNDEINLKKEKLEMNVNVLEYFYNCSDIVFCMTSTDHLLSLGNVLHVVEMSMISQENRKKVIEHMSQGYTIKDALDVTAKVAGAASYFYTPLKPVVKGVTAVSYLLRDKQNKDQATPGKQFVGPNQFGKLFFIINKIDLSPERVEHSFFELGCAIGRNFSRIPLPLSSQVFAIGCPMEQRRNVAQHMYIPLHEFPLSKLKIGALRDVEAKLQRLREEQHEQSLHVQQIGDLWKMIKKEHSTLTIWDKYMKMNEFRRAKRIVDSYPSLKNNFQIKSNL